MLETYIRRYNLSNARNFRDLGGYQISDGRVTKYHKFFRSDLLTSISEADNKVFDALNIKLVIDLRDDSERMDVPSKFTQIKGIKELHIPLLNGVIGGAKLKNAMDDISANDEKNLLKNLYIATAKKCQLDLVRVLAALSEIKQGSAIYHCTAGKDRTGMISALILDLVGVEKADIIADYQISCTLIKDEFFKKDGAFGNMNYLASDPENIETFLNYIHDTFGTTEKFLIESGMEQTKINDLKTLVLS